MKNLLFLALVFLLACSPKVWHKAEITSSGTRINATAIDSDSIMLTMIQPYKSQANAKMSEIIGENEAKLDKGKPESTLTNFLADLVQNTVERKTGEKLDGTITNYGGVRVAYLAQGKVTLGNVYEIMPFDNMIVVLRINGRQLQTFCDHVASDGGWPVSKTLHFEIKDGKAENIKLNNISIQADNTYRICVPDYVANGGDDCSFLKDVPRTSYNIFLRDVIIDGVKQISKEGQKIHSQKDGRLINLK